ncbi:MAG: hypothetical protein QXD66_04395 [Candidatus Nezhaarchaeales archaeon]|nr:MAG: hypothetical protein DSO06_02115 [Candidatus Nezhaarchaeota archaeon WYZ-LMO8]TDA36845.1 MAG: hypothetical protein DSO05_02170 [Candidatus Nezhaarchaeota archaeon WYZ-LMO7]
MGRSYLVVGDGNKPLLKSLEIAKGKRIVVSDKPLEVDGFIEILDIFKQFNQIASLPLELSENDSLVLDLYAHVSRLSALSRYASVKLYLRLCRMLIASAKAKCFNIYINCNRSSKLYVKLRATVDEEVPC